MRKQFYANASLNVACLWRGTMPAHFRLESGFSLECDGGIVHRKNQGSQSWRGQEIFQSQGARLVRAALARLRTGGDG